MCVKFSMCMARVGTAIQNCHCKRRPVTGSSLEFLTHVTEQAHRKNSCLTWHYHQCMSQTLNNIRMMHYYLSMLNRVMLCSRLKSDICIILVNCKNLLSVCVIKGYVILDLHCKIEIYKYFTPNLVSDVLELYYIIVFNIF